MTHPDRLSSLEETTAHNAAAIDDISKQMADQWAAIRKLEQKLDLVLDHLRQMRVDMEESDSAPTERPPHY